MTRMSLHSKITLTALCVVALSSCQFPAHADGRTSSADTELLLAGDTVVTASKKAQKASDVPAAVTVITEEDIRASGAVTILDLLRSVPGVDVMEMNRGVANVSIRGFNGQYANKLLVMVDGRSIYQDIYGNILWSANPLLISRIKRIEIVRGPGSALYGANAFNGVINIITKTPAEMAKDPAKTSVRSLVGEQNSTLTEIQTTAGKARDWSYSLGAGYNRTDGFGGRQPGQVRDSYTVPVLTFDAEKRLKRGNLWLAAGNSEAISDYNGGLSLQDGAWHTSYVSLTYSEDKVKNPIMARVFGNFFYLDEPGRRDASSQTYDFEAQQSRDLSRQHSLVYGLSYRQIQAFTFVTGSNQQDLFALYGQDDFHLARQTHLFAGVRLDDHSVYGVTFTPRVSLVHHLSQKQSLRLSYGTSFRDPSIVDTYLNYQYPIAPGVVGTATGNPALKPEKVTSYELGYRKEIPGGHLGVNLFYNQITDLITTTATAFAPSPPFPPGIATATSYINGGGATAVGLELESEFRIARGVRGLFNYSYQDVEGSDGERVDLSPQHKFNVGVQANLSSHIESYLGVHFVGASVFHDTTVLPIHAYARVDARLGYRFGTKSRPWTISAVAINLFDDKHLEFPMGTSAGTATESTPQRRTLYLMVTGKL
ncbi:MAG TPA: TonB-dependent receptor [Chthonomonadaceae bacterium]|nr:TonB-dependent receptor [Chthonomonadaceae bacterium]